MAIQPERPQSIGGVLDTSFQLYKASVLKVWPICLIAAISSTLPAIYMFTAGAGDPTNPFGALEVIGSPMYWVVYVFTLVLSLWAAAALYAQQSGIGVDQDPGAGAALKDSLGRVPALFVMIILFSIALAIGLILLVIPGLILMVSLILGANVLVLERKGPVESLKTSHSLIWGNWWRSAAILTVGFIIVMVVYVAIGFAIGLAIPIAGVAGEDALLAISMSSILISALMTFLLAPYYTALLIALYWDLKLRKQGEDLASRVAALNPA